MPTRNDVTRIFITNKSITKFLIFLSGGKYDNGSLFTKLDNDRMKY